MGAGDGFKLGMSERLGEVVGIIVGSADGLAVGNRVTLGFGVGRSVGSTVGMTAVGGWRLMGDAIATFAVVASVHAHG